ncbi:MAG: pentapeptide repeat-containing protein [Bacteroidales bacterium]
MASTEFYHQHFTNADYAAGIPPKSTFESCTFEGLLLANHSLNKLDFIDCTFIDCDFSSSQWAGTGIKNCSFHGCKLIGIDFTICQPFLFYFSADACNLSYSQFSNCSMEKFVFSHCIMQEVDFSGAQLQKTIFNECVLTGTLFEQTHLEQADFRTARGFSIHPENNRLKGTRFSANNLEGLIAHLPIKIE